VKVSRFIARRYFFSGKNTSAVNIISGISVLGYAVGSFALLVLLSALNGFERIIFKTYENYYPDLKIQPVSGKVFAIDEKKMHAIAGISGVEKIAVALEENAIVQYADNQVVATIKGVEKTWPAVVKIDSLLIAGTPIFENGRGASFAWLAEGLVYKLSVNNSNNAVTIMAPRRESVGVAQMEMNEDNIGVSAVIRAGEEQDDKLLLVPLPWAQALFERDGEASAVEVKIRPGFSAAEIKKEIQKMTGPEMVVLDRYEQNRAVYKMFNTEKWVSFSLMAFVLLLISFNLLGSLSMLVLEKKHDIKLLSHIGMRLKSIQAVFFREGLLVAMAGTLAGLVLGVILVLIQQKFGIVTTQSSIAAVYPVALKATDLLFISGLCGLLGISSAIYPALKSVQSL
jgi:lipoprotein-releasing system permease protein